MYDLIEKKRKVFFIVANKYLFFISLCSLFIFIIMAVVEWYNSSTLYIAAIAFAILSAACALTFFITWKKHKVKYGLKLSINDDIITVFDYQNLPIKEFHFGCLNKKYVKVAFDEIKRSEDRNCLVLYAEYSDFEPYENMLYGEYWNDPNVIIIQDPELIEMINKIVN